MKTNSTCKFLRGLLIFLVGMLGFAVSGVGQNYKLETPYGWGGFTFFDKNGASADNTAFYECGGKYVLCFSTNAANRVFYLVNGSNYFAITPSTGVSEDGCNYWLDGANRCAYKIPSQVTKGYLVIDGTNVSFKSVEPNCGNSVASASASVYGTGSSSACLSSNPQLTSTYEVGSGSFTPRYQWYKDGSPISDERNSTYTPNSIGSYTVKVYAGDYSDPNPATSNAVSITGPTVTTATLSSDNSVYCSSGTNLTVDDNAACCPSEYPKYVWYKDGAEITTTTSPSYAPSSAGNWKVVVKADASTIKESNTITLSSPNPSITVSPSELSLQALMSGEASSGSLAVSLDNSCSTLKTPVITGANASMYSVTNNNNGTYTITFTPGATKDSYPATITFSSADDAVSQAATLKGKVVSCISSNVASFDFDSQGLGTSNGITLTTSMTNQTSQNWDPGYMIGSGNKTYYGGQGTMSYNTGNCFQFYYKNTLNDQSVLTLSGTSLDASAYYGIEFLIGEAGTNGKTNEVYGEVYIDGVKVGEVKYLSATTIRTVFSGADLQSGKSIVVRGVNHTSDDNTPANCYVYYIDNLTVSKSCPPEIKYSTFSNDCDVNPSFTAEVTKGSADVVKYEWYVLEEGQSPVLVATHNSSSLTDVFSQSAEIGTGKKVKVVVTDANGLSADVEYEINCGPVINDIIVPSEICPNGILSLDVPSYTSSSTVIDEGWEIAESATATRSEWIELSLLNSIPESYKNWYIRYFVENAEGRGKSNAVQITMFDAPNVSPVSVGDICSGDAFVLTAPNVVYDATDDSEEWQYATQADFSDATAFTSSDTFDDEGTYYIRYAATDVCTTSYATTTANVNDPSLSVTEYPTYMGVAGTEQVVASAPVLDATCVGTLTYSITDGNGAGYFAIDENTGVITMTPAATTTGDFPITVTITDGVNTVTEDLTISLTVEPTLSLQCSGTTDYYVYTKYQKLNLQNIVTSRYVNEDVALTLSGSAASYFSLSPTSVSKNTNNVPVSISQNDYFTGVGDYTLKLTATTQGLTRECNVNIHVKNLNITDYINDQINCSGVAPSLMVEAIGEDATNLPLTYQWYKDNVAIPGATSSSYAPTRAGSGSGAYHCVVSTNGNVLHTTDKANVSFVEGVPELTFNENPAESGVVIPTEIFCSQEIGAVMKVTFGGKDVTEDYDHFWWRNSLTNKYEGVTASGVHTFSFDCSKVSAPGGTDATIGVTIIDNTSGCSVTTIKTVHVKPMGNTYYYCGNTGDDSDVTNPEKWCTSPNATPSSSCGNPAYVIDGNGVKHFNGNGCQYIINKDNVKLKSAEKWVIEGVGSKLSVGTGKWESTFTSAGGDWYRDTQGGEYFERYDESPALKSSNYQEKLTQISSHDYRADAKKFVIEGTLNTGNDVSVDVLCGGSLTIATDKGDFLLGTMEKDKLKTEYRTGTANEYKNVYYSPGASVTYKGEGAKRILSGDYSQLYIEDVATDNFGDISFEDDATITVSQVLKNGTNVSLNNIDPNGSTIIYIGEVNQEIAALKYYNLQTEAASTKTLAGDIEVTHSLNIGAGSTLAAGKKIDDSNSVSYDITVSGSGDDAVIMIGKFDSWKSTFTYSSTNPTTVEAMNYYNLNLGNYDRTLSNENIIGIAGTFTPGTGNKTITGSTIEFNGSESQSIPEFTFYNLALNNTAMRANTGNVFDEAYFITQEGDVEVTNNLILTEGILTNEKDDDTYWSLLVSNPVVSAVGQGYHGIAQYNSRGEKTGVKDVNTRASYINGELTRSLPDGLDPEDQNEASLLYVFPVGDADGYKPLTMNQISTTVNPKVAVSIEYNGMAGRLIEGDASTEVNSGFAWHVDDKNSGFETASVGVSTTSSNNISITPNALAYGSAYDGVFENVLGSNGISGDILFSEPRGEGYYTYLHRVIPNKTYYYDCTGGGNPSDISSWWTVENGSSSSDPSKTHPVSFSELDAKWIIKCNCDVTIDRPLVINGTNSIVEISMGKPDGVVKKLNINSDVEFLTSTIKKGTVQVGTSGEWTVDYGFKMEDVYPEYNGEYSNRSSLINNGRVNLYMADIVLTDSYIENNGYLYSENVNWDLSSPLNGGGAPNKANVWAESLEMNYSQFQHTRFINNSKIEMINANFYASHGGNGNGPLHIRNAENAVWLIDNTNMPGNSYVKFEGVEFAHENKGFGYAYVDFQCNSYFVVKHSDVKMDYKGNLSDQASIGGNIIVEDGNMSWGRTTGSNGGEFTLEQTCGNIYLKDTDNSGDGILQCLGKEGYKIYIEGSLHAMGIVINDITDPNNNGGGREFHVKDGGSVFVGNIGASVAEYTWLFKFVIEHGGKMYYCGNRSAGPDGLGENHGKLYYAGNYYITDPITEQDFKEIFGNNDTQNGTSTPMYTSEEDCMEAYYEGIPKTETIFTPVGLTLLYGICIDDNKVELRWQTASETDNSHFVILRSFDGVHFEEVDYIMGAGTTTEVHDYEFYDTDDKEGIVYYKLRQVDYDGNYTDSKVIAVQTCGKNARFSIGSEEIEVFFRNPQANYVVITSVTGQIFYSKKFTNVEEARIAVPQRKGIYIISVIDNKQITSEKFIR